MSNNAHDLSNRLLNALDNNYNVVDMHTVNEIISILEKFNITKELLETTRLGKHVNELRRKTTDPTLARRAKVLVKRWRDLVIPNVASPAHTGSNSSSAERTVRRLGGTPLTSPALSRQVLSPLVPSPRPPSRPAWGGYESDSQDVILVDDDPPPPPASASASAASTLATRLPAHKPLTPPVKRPPSPEPPHDDKKAKRDKKPKKRRGHSRAGAGTEASEGAGGGGSWTARNGAHPERRRNGCRRDATDTYAALVSRMPRAGDKKVKTTKELLEQIQSRGSKPSASPGPASPASPDVMLIEPESCPIKVDSPLRNGGSESRAPTPPRSPSPLPPLEDEREYAECTCGEIAEENCPAARRWDVRPFHVRALHCLYLPGVNGTRAPLHPHQFAVRKPFDPERPGLFTSVVPLYKYSDYADDYCVKNMSKVPLCTHLPWTEFAPPPPDLPPPKSPPPLRPYPIDFETKHELNETQMNENPEELSEHQSPKEEKMDIDCPKVEPEMIGIPKLEPSERLKAPLLLTEDETQFKNECNRKPPPKVEKEFKSETPEHRTVERTKGGELDGKSLYELCERTIKAIPYDYSQVAAAPIITLPDDGKKATEVLETALTTAQDCERDELGRPPRATNFAEWQECAQLGRLIALPYVVID